MTLNLPSPSAPAPGQLRTLQFRTGEFHVFLRRSVSSVPELLGHLVRTATGFVPMAATGAVLATETSRVAGAQALLKRSCAIVDHARTTHRAVRPTHCQLTSPASAAPTHPAMAISG